MDWLKLFYFFIASGHKGLDAGTYLVNTKQYPCLLLAFITLLTCAAGFSCYFYFVHTAKRVEKTAKRSELWKIFLYGMLSCFVLTEIVIATTNKLANSNIIKPFWGNYGDVFYFSLINSVIYYFIIFAIIAFLMKSKSKNAKGIWLF